MKRKNNPLLFKFKYQLFSVLCVILIWPAALMADPPDPPPPPSGHGQNGDAPVGAPIDGGMGILLALGAAYGGVRLWKSRKLKVESRR
jgi:hypothetical protein